MVEYKVSFNTFVMNPDPKAIEADCARMARDGWRVAAAAIGSNMVLIFWERERQTA